ncbi:MAG TPA: transcriptional repressor LexA [Bryobacteraceae bacterium]
MTFVLYSPTLEPGCTMALTRRQKEVMDFLTAFMKKHGYSPSYEEVAAGLGLASLATVHKHIQALEAKQYLRRNYNHSRSLEIGERYLEEEKARVQFGGNGSIPLLGRIAAGAPVEAIADPEPLHFSDFVKDENTFALQVRGDSMIEDHICGGDFVLVEKTDAVKNGDIVVALVDGADATLKRYYLEPDGRVRLQPANSSMAPIFVDPSQLQIQGRLLAVMRKY